MLSVREIDQLIEDDWKIKGDEYTYSGYWDLDNEMDNRWSNGKVGEYQPVEIERLGLVTLVEDIGGEGQGDHMHLVFRVQMVDGSDRLFKKDGYYSSYGDSEYDSDLYEVEPVQKTITKYEAV